MLDINFIVENKDIVAHGAERKRIRVDLDNLIALEEKRAHGDTSVLKQWQQLMLAVPNMPDITVPDGKTPENNVLMHEYTASQDVEVLTAEVCITHFAIERAPAHVLVAPHELIAAGVDPKDDTLVHVTDTQVLTPHLQVPLLARGESAAAAGSVFAYAQDDSVAELQEYVLVHFGEAAHHSSVEIYQEYITKIQSLFETYHITHKAYTVCAGQLLPSEVAAVLWVHNDKPVARVAYHHDFLARRLGKRDAHTVTLTINLTHLQHDTTQE